MKPIIAIVGIPNVGKSTLFNRLIRRRQAIVTDLPGVTRDRQYGNASLDGREVHLVDTGGLTPNTEAPFANEIERQAEQAMAEASVILFVLDARADLTALDHAVAARLRKSNAPVLLVANKAEGKAGQDRLGDFYSLGLGDPIFISAEHGEGIGTLAREITQHLPEKIEDSYPGSTEEKEGKEDATDGIEPSGFHRPLAIALVGRPNVGKSSLFNRLIGKERAMVSDIPGTTRDAIDTHLEFEGRTYCLIDTAGMRRRGKLRERVERFSVVRAKKSIDRADVCVLVLDASEMLAAQDTHIAGAILDAKKPFVVAINKWDLTTNREQAAKDWMERVRYRLRFAKDVPMLLVSAKTGQRVDKLLDIADRLYEVSGTRVSTPAINRWLKKAASFESGAPAAGRRVNLLYATQTGTHPPTFVLFCSDPKKIHFSMRRYLENSLREEFQLESVPLKLILRQRSEAKK